MPTLEWIGKRAVVNHHREVPYHLLACDPELSVGDPDSGNLVVQGDNLLALKALLPYYAGKVKLIYIDPPYNTGNENWVYNDNVNSPEIRAWLGRVVGPEAQDLSRHDKWLCMMYPRLSLLREFLSEDGAVLASIDDNEAPRLRLLMDELFGARNHLATVVWQTEGNFDNQAKIKICHEYVLAYGRDASQFPMPNVIHPNVGSSSKLHRENIVNTIVKNGPKNPQSVLVLPEGFPASFGQGVIPARTNKYPHYDEDVVVSDGRLAHAARAFSGWSCKRICERFIESGFQPVPDSRGKPTSFQVSHTGAIEAVKERKGGGEPQGHVISVVREVGTTNKQRMALQEWGLQFPFPKPIGLVQYLVWQRPRSGVNRNSVSYSLAG